MTVRIRLLGGAMLGVVAAAPPPSSAPHQRCEKSQPQLVAGPTGQAQLRRLDELPSAERVLTVLRTEGGCTRPVVVRYDIPGERTPQR